MLVEHPVDNLIRVAPFALRDTSMTCPECGAKCDPADCADGCCPECGCDMADAPEEAGATLTGHFAVFNQWTQICSWYEGDFLERVAPGAFTDVFRDASGVRVLYDHGYDGFIGNKPLGTITSLREDKVGAAYDVALFDAGYVNDLLPALRAGQMGASFRFKVAGEAWVEPDKPTAWNPGKLPERTITKVAPLYEFGPVTFPAYAGATAGVRSGTDQFFDRLLSDPAFVARLAERASPRSVEHMIEQGRAGHAPGAASSRSGHVPGATGMHPSVIRIKAAALSLAR